MRYPRAVLCVLQSLDLLRYKGKACCQTIEKVSNRSENATISAVQLTISRVHPVRNAHANIPYHTVLKSPYLLCFVPRAANLTRSDDESSLTSSPKTTPFSRSYVSTCTASTPSSPRSVAPPAPKSCVAPYCGSGKARSMSSSSRKSWLTVEPSRRYTQSPTAVSSF